MKADLQLETMSTEEKLETMEALWADLSKSAPEQLIPGWHEQLLIERERRLAEGKEKVLDWEEAKTQIRRSIDESKDT